MSTDLLPPPLRATANPSPPRAAGSVRRTTSIDVSWPDGFDKNRLMIGTARDYLTPAQGGTGHVLAEARFDARLAEDKTIVSISARPEPANLKRLVGERGGGHLRLVLREIMPELLESGDPLYLLLDDISGTALVSAFAWSQWHDDWRQVIRSRMSDEELAKIMSQRVNICWGLKEGNSGLAPGGPPGNVAEADAGELRNPADPQGWHDLPENEGAGFRRARRIDVMRDSQSGLLKVHSSFQDSAKRRDGGRVAIHEYDLEVTVDPDTLEITSLEPQPRILPFSECPGAVHNAKGLVGCRIDAIRDEVLAQLRGT
ncbi:MAG: DUF2889 domain-containing protein, partial [Novosphingobium sp.]|nr:DUF2889 domain-containing protein [Novosphingobium sp.]